MTNISVSKSRKLERIQNRACAIAETTSTPLIKRAQNALCELMQHIKGNMHDSSAELGNLYAKNAPLRLQYRM